MGPDFICIGAQRSGTTWLYSMLTRHPDIWMTPVKELHYFDDPKRSRYFKDLKKRWGKNFLLSKWDLRYFFGKHSDQWYASLFADASKNGMIVGEASPSYAIMDEKLFTRMHNINPNVKIIFLMRNPLERSWSNYMNLRKKNRKLSSVPATASDAITLCSRPKNLARSNYLQTINIIESIFPQEQIFYGFFEDISARPKWFSEKLLSFLGAEIKPDANIIPEGAINSAARGTTIPHEFKSALAPLLAKDLQQLAAKFGGYTEVWHQEVQALLKNNN